ncbi:MAG: protein-glutamate methylesterase/protein-glutamine glutaminase [Treponema sp.]
MEQNENNADTISVAICDDSALMRNLISRIIGESPLIKVVGKSMNGKMLLDLVPSYRPDVIVLDIEMPVMNGVEFLKARKENGWDIPVIILSSVATKGAAVTMECLELGASDFITKPGGSISIDIEKVKEVLIEKIVSYGGSYARKHGKKIPFADDFIKLAKMEAAENFVAKRKGLSAETGEHKEQLRPVFLSSRENKEPVVITPLRSGGTIKIIAIGISTGGPNALREVFAAIDPELKQPILVVQHMPAGFTTEFAASLNRICPLTVVEAADNMPIESGHIYIAPGNYHIIVEERPGKNVIRTVQTPQRNGHRPSADVLFESVAKIYANNALGVIMTGMGRDGAAELAEMRKQGAYTLGQDEKSAIVYGMPRVGFELGGVQKQVSLSDMAGEISRLAREHR